jgi:8-oxo-dGTP pyrophosphatase MutT (NUDIX family)
MATKDKLIGTVRDKKFNLDLSDPSLRIKERKAVRVILLSKDNRIGLVCSKSGSYYMLPGGRIEDSESEEQAVFREVIEETGYESEIIEKIGYTIEYYHSPQKFRASHDCMIGYSYCYVARATKFTGDNRTEYELDESLEFIWADSLDKAINLFKNAQFHETKNIHYELIEVIEERDRIILEEYKRLIK